MSLPLSLFSECEMELVHKRVLFEVAKKALVYAVEARRPLSVDLADYPRELRAERATFVSLHERDGSALRGCVGTLVAHRPLVADVAYNAYAASNEDMRFSPVEKNELPLEISISILSLPEQMQARTEAHLVGQMRVGVDGLIISDGVRSATFLPVMWEQLPSPEEFLRALKHKAGFAEDYWSPKMAAYRYTADTFGEEVLVG